MKIASLTVLAAAAAGALALEQRQEIPTGISINPTVISVLGVLRTALPDESLSFAMTNPGGFASQVDSSIKAGQTPAWFSALPADVKSYLPSLYPAAAAASTIPSVTAASSSAFPTSASGSITPSQNSTTLAVSSATLSSSGGANSATDVPTGGVAYPTAAMGAGLAGAIGFLGMLAL